MKFEYTLAELSTAITALEQVYGKVSVLDPYLGTVLDPATLQPTDKAEELTALDETGRGVQLAQADDGPELVLYQGIQADARPCVLAFHCCMPHNLQSSAGAENSFNRVLAQMQEELRRARRQVRRRTARVAVGVLAAVLALGVLAQLVLFPAINRRAVKVDWSDTLKAGDPANLPATMQVFTALRIPRANFSGVYAESSGFGTEKLTFLFWDKDGSFSVSGRVTLGILHGLEGDVARLQAAGYRLIGDFSEYTAHLSEEELQARQRETLALRRETLAALPSGVKVYASIHFAEDLTFETLAQLLADWQDEDLTFENIRVNTYLSGGDLFLTVSPGGANLTDYNDAYPMLDLYQQPLTAENLRQSLESRLQYMADHQKIVDWIDPDAAAYQTKSYSYLLKGLQDVGMTFDGAYVTASPAALLRLIDSGLVEGVGLKDADFDLS